MIKKKPSISVIIPYYNRSDLLIETLKSIISQTFKNFEVLIINDGSDESDYLNTKQFLSSLKDERIILINRHKSYPKGANGCRSHGYDLASGKYIKWFDSDDIMNSNFLELQYNFLKKNDSFDGVLSNCGVYNYDFSKKIKVGWRSLCYSTIPITDYAKSKLGWQTGAGLWKRKSLFELSPFSQNLTNAQEWVFHFFIITSNLKVAVSEKENFKIRFHNNSIRTGRKKKKYLFNRFKARIIAVNRLTETGNSGRRFLFKSIAKMFLKFDSDLKILGIKYFIQNLKIRRKMKSKANLIKIN